MRENFRFETDLCWRQGLVLEEIILLLWLICVVVISLDRLSLPFVSTIIASCDRIRSEVRPPRSLTSVHPCIRNISAGTSSVFL